MTDDDLTRLRDEVAEALERMTADVSDADHVRYRSGYDEGCRTCVRVRREACEVADALLPLLARKIAEARGEALREALSGVTTHNGTPVTVKNLRWAATHEALCRSYIFDVLMGLADALEGQNSPETAPGAPNSPRRVSADHRDATEPSGER